MSNINRPPLFIKKVLKALFSWAFSNISRSLSGGSLSHRLLRLPSSGPSDTPGKTGKEHSDNVLHSLSFLLYISGNENSTAVVLPWVEPAEAMLSDEARLALANTCSRVSGGSFAHCFRGRGSVVSQPPLGNNTSGVNSLGHLFLFSHKLPH